MTQNEKQDLKMYCFEQARGIIEKTIEVNTKNTIDNIFDLSERIYKYLTSEDGK